MPLDQRLERSIVEQNLILGVVDDIFELVVEQPRIYGVQHAAHADDAEPGDQVTVVIHGQRGDPVAGFYPEPLERLASRRASSAARQSVRTVVPSARAATISRVPCSRSAWSRVRMIRSGNSCIAPSITDQLPERERIMAEKSAVAE